MVASQLIAKKVAVVRLQVHLHREMIADLQGLGHHKETSRVTSSAKCALEPNHCPTLTFTSSSMRWKVSLKLNGWADPGTMQEIISRPCTMILFGSKGRHCCRHTEAAAAAAHFLWPVVSAVRLLANGGVLLVPDQPVKPGIAPQPKSLPAFDGDVAAAGVQVSQDHHILEGWGMHRVAQALNREVFGVIRWEKLVSYLTHIDFPLLANGGENIVQLVDFLHGVLRACVLPDEDKILNYCKTIEILATHRTKSNNSTPQSFHRPAIFWHNWFLVQNLCLCNKICGFCSFFLVVLRM